MSKRPRTESVVGSDHKRGRNEHWSLGADDHPIYDKVDAGIAAELRLADQTIPSSIQELIGSIVATGSGMKSAQAKLENKRVMLDNSVREPNQEERQRRKTAHAMSRQKVLSGREQKRRGMLNIDRKMIKYSIFEPIHHLWLQYFQQATSSSTNLSILQSKIIKSDLHGAIIMVLRSRSPSLIGQRGIVYKETQHSFEIVTHTDATKVILKAHSVFGIQFNGALLEIYGSNFLFRPSERSVKKYKPHGILSL